MSKLREILGTKKFGATAKVNKLLKDKAASDVELAIAARGTKAYREDSELKTAVDKIVAGGSIEPKVEKQAAPVRSSRSGESR